MIAILDIDGTLVDTNYQHTIAWYRALRAHDAHVADLADPPPHRDGRRQGGRGAVRRRVRGRAHGDESARPRARSTWQLIDEVEPFEGARGLIEDLSGGHTVVLASSAKEEEVDHYLDLLDVRELADDWTTSATSRRPSRRRPRPARRSRRPGGGDAVMIGDTPWDIKAAGAEAMSATVSIGAGPKRRSDANTKSSDTETVAG